MVMTYLKIGATSKKPTYFPSYLPTQVCAPKVQNFQPPPRDQTSTTRATPRGPAPRAALAPRGLRLHPGRRLRGHRAGELHRRGRHGRRAEPAALGGRGAERGAEGLRGARPARFGGGGIGLVLWVGVFGLCWLVWFVGGWVGWVWFVVWWVGWLVGLFGWLGFVLAGPRGFLQADFATKKSLILHGGFRKFQAAKGSDDLLKELAERTRTQKLAHGNCVEKPDAEALLGELAFDYDSVNHGFGPPDFFFFFFFFLFFFFFFFFFFFGGGGALLGCRAYKSRWLSRFGGFGALWSVCSWDHSTASWVALPGTSWGRAWSWDRCSWAKARPGKGAWREIRGTWMNQMCLDGNGT